MDCFETDGTRVVWRGDGETLVVEPWGANSLRVRSALSHDVVDTDYALLAPSVCVVSVAITGDTARLTNGNITAELYADDLVDGAAGYRRFRCAVSFYDASGKRFLREVPHGGALKLKARSFRPIAGGDHQVTAMFEADPAEKLFGMGQYQQELLDLKGATLELAHRNSQASVPFVLSSAGYGFFWHSPAIGRATFAANRTEWVAESAVQLDYWVTVGSTPAEITAAYAGATGHAPAMPAYGLGYWQCALRYWSQEQLLEVAREHKRRGLPIDVIVADFFHWPKMGDYRFEDEFWPDPVAMTQELKELGVELMVSVWPQVSVESENFADLRKNNLLARAARGLDVQMSFEGPSMFLDVTNQGARDAIWELCRRNYYDKGVRLFWLDEAEPEYGAYDFDNYRYHLGPVLQVGNLYPQAFSRAFYEGMRGAGQEEIVNLVRCVWAGSQRYGALAWSGDILSTFDALRCQVLAGIHMGVAGIPWFTSDIGGFAGGDPSDPDFVELLIRWFQFATFCPVMRMHGERLPLVPVTATDGTKRVSSGSPNEVWSFGEPTYEILARYIRFRERMRPYLVEVMDDAHLNGQPVMRGLFHEFPDDPRAWDVADQFLLGPQLLVAPVLELGARTRAVYFPAGASWTDIHTGQIQFGGSTLEVTADVDVIPAYTRDGTCEDLIGRL